MFAALCWLSGTGAMAGPAMDQGITAFNAGQFQQALLLFKQDLQQNSENALSHYYMGLCLHHMNRLPEATTEYKWVFLNSKDPELIYRVQLGLQVLEKKPLPKPPVKAAAPAHTPPSTPPTPPAQSSAPAQPAQNSQTPPTGAEVGMILAFCTDTPESKKVGPLLSSAAAMYKGRLLVQAINAESAMAKSLISRYNIVKYPTVLFLNRGAQVLKRIDGQSPTMAVIQSTVTQLYR